MTEVEIRGLLPSPFTWTHVMLTGTRSSETCCHLTVPPPADETWKTSAQRRRRCPSLFENEREEEPALQGVSSYRQGFRLSGPQLQLSLFPMRKSSLTVALDHDLALGLPFVSTTILLPLPPSHHSTQEEMSNGESGPICIYLSMWA